MNRQSPTVTVGVLDASDQVVLDALKSSGAVQRWSALPTLVVSGPDRSTWLNGLLSCDVGAVGEGRGTWGLLLDRLGKIQAVLAVLADDVSLYLGVLWGDVELVERELDARLVMEDAELTRLAQGAEWCLFVGNASEAAAGGARARGTITMVGSNTLAVFVETLPVLGETPSLSESAWTWLRVTHGLGWGGIDFDEGDRPHEAAMERRAVSWSKGCYLGQEVVCMQDMRGKVKRSVRPFTARAGAHSASVLGSEVWMGGKSVGRVTSAIFEPNQERYRVLAQVPLVAAPEGGGGEAGEMGWACSTDARLVLQAQAD